MRALSGWVTARHVPHWRTRIPTSCSVACNATTRWPDIFASADLFLFPSLSETFGNVTLEAMASGLPIVAYDYGAAREHLRDAAPTAAVPVGDEAAFIEATLHLATDDAARGAIARAVRPATAALHPGRLAADFDAMLQALAEEARR